MPGSNDTLTVYDLASTPLANINHAMPRGHTMAEVTIVDVGNATQGRMRILLGDGAGDIKSLNYYEGVIRSDVASITAITNDKGMFVSGDETAGIMAHISVFNMQTLSPVVMLGEWFESSPENRTAVFNNVDLQDEIYLDMDNGGTMNAGTIYIRTLKRKATVWTHDFDSGADGNATLASPAIFTGLTKGNSGLIVLSTAAALTNDTSESFRGRVSVDGGATFDDGASDYIRSHHTTSADDVSEKDYFSVIVDQTVIPGANVIIYGLPTGARTIFRTFDANVVASGAYRAWGSRQLGQVENAFSVFPPAGTISAGVLYATGYKM